MDDWDVLVGSFKGCSFVLEKLLLLLYHLFFHFV